MPAPVCCGAATTSSSEIIGLIIRIYLGAPVVIGNQFADNEMAKSVQESFLGPYNYSNLNWLAWGANPT